MPFESRKVYRALNGEEIKTIMSQRVLAAMQMDNALNIARAFPLIRYEITVRLTPYQLAGKDAKPDVDVVYEVDGSVYVPSNAEPTVELVESSPLYGVEADPQELRRLAEQGTVETARTSTGELVDVRTKPGTKEPPVMPESVTPAAEPPPPADEDPAQTYAAEEQRWKSRKDPEVERATSMALRNFEESGEIKHPGIAAGRVSIIKSAAQGGGSEHGKVKR